MTSNISENANSFSSWNPLGFLKKSTTFALDNFTTIATIGITGIAVNLFQNSQTAYEKVEAGQFLVSGMTVICLTGALVQTVRKRYAIAVENLALGALFGGASYAVQSVKEDMTKTSALLATTSKVTKQQAECIDELNDRPFISRLLNLQPAACAPSQLTPLSHNYAKIGPTLLHQHIEAVYAAGKQLKLEVDEALKCGGSIVRLMPNHLVWAIQNAKGKKIAIFKPNQEFFEISTRNHLAKLFDLESKFNMPDGVIIPMLPTHLLQAEDLFIANIKDGYLQRWVPDSVTIGEYCAEDDLEKMYTSSTAINDFPLDNFQRIGILDTLFLNQDRNGGNLLATQTGSIPHLIPIDHDLTFPPAVGFINSFLGHERSKKPFTEESKRFIKLLASIKNEVHRAPLLQYFQKLPKHVSQNVIVSIELLEKFCDEGKTLADLHEFIKKERCNTYKNSIFC